MELITWALLVAVTVTVLILVVLAIILIIKLIKISKSVDIMVSRGQGIAEKTDALMGNAVEIATTLNVVKQIRNYLQKDHKRKGENDEREK